MAQEFDKILAFLRKSNNPAADQAIGSALLCARESQITPLVQSLLDRGKDDGIAYAIRMYHKIDPAQRQELIDRCPGISGALRLACKDGDPQVRDNVISIIHASNQPKLLYFLSLLLRDELPVLRTHAARAFKSIAISIWNRVRAERDENRNSGEYVPSASVAESLHQLFLALDSSLENFTCHLRTEIVEVGMIFGAILPDSTWARFTADRSRIGRIAVEILTRESNVQFAGFAFRALSGAELGKNISRLIASSCNGDFLRRWLDYAWYRFDFNVRKNLARIKEFRWLSGNYQPILETPQDLQIKFVDVLMLTSVPAKEKLELLVSLLMSRGEAVQEHVVSVLINCDLPEKGQYLTRGISVCQTQLVHVSPVAMEMAMRYLHQAKVEAVSEDVRAEGFVQPAEHATDTERYFEQFWMSFDRVEISACRSAGEKLQRMSLSFDRHLREKLKAANYEDRLRALSLVRRAGLTRFYADDVLRLCDDEHVMVRSAAVSALADIPGPASERKLIEAMDDENLRVQANGIEVLESYNVPNLFETLEPKLRSSNNRVRANAIKAILKPQYSIGIRALMAMLDHPDASFRRSALWAVSQTFPIHLIKKVHQMMTDDPDPDVKNAAARTVREMAHFWKETQNSKAEPVSGRVGK
jgi:hypothetical protein